jgi:hypothetical protein
MFDAIYFYGRRWRESGATAGGSLPDDNRFFEKEKRF